MGSYQHSHPISARLIGQIFLTFFKISPVTFGGGYAMIPLIEREIVERRKWLQTEELADVFAMAESVPGAIALNTSIFIGYRMAGVRGAIAALLGTLLPTFFLVLLLSLLYLRLKDHPKVEAAFMAIRVTVVALIAYAAIKIGKTAAVDLTTIGIIGISIGLMWFTPLHPIFLILGGACAGITAVAVKRKFRVSARWIRPGKPAEKPAPEMVYKYSDYYFGDGI